MSAHDLVLFWDASKTWLTDLLDVDRTSLHVHLGLAIFLLAGPVARKPVGSRTALLVLVALEGLNEAFDTWRYVAAGWPWTPRGTIVDLVATLFWPAVLTLLLRHRSAPRDAGDARTG